MLGKSRLDNKHVVFGHVVDGTKVVDAIEAYGTSGGRPSGVVVIEECGEIK
jgi:peptidylprolyl isomerase